MTESTRPLALLLVAALSGAAGAAMAWALHPSADPAAARSAPTGGLGVSPAADDRLAAEVQALAEAVRALAAPPASGAEREPAPPQPLAAAQDAALLETLRELTRAMERLGAASSQPLAGDDVTLPSREDADAELARLASSWGSDATIPYIDLFGLSPREVIRTLGRPSIARVDDGTITWTYYGRGSYEGSINITFAEGYVINQYKTR